MPAERTAMPSSFVERLIGESVVALALLGWWALARHLPEFILPGPLAVAQPLLALFASDGFPRERCHLNVAGSGLYCAQRS